MFTLKPANTIFFQNTLKRLVKIEVQSTEYKLTFLHFSSDLAHLALKITNYVSEIEC